MRVPEIDSSKLSTICIEALQCNLSMNDFQYYYLFFRSSLNNFSLKIGQISIDRAAHLCVCVFVCSSFESGGVFFPLNSKDEVHKCSRSIFFVPVHKKKFPNTYIHNSTTREIGARIQTHMNDE